MKKHTVVAATATLIVGLSAGVTAASAADWLYYSVSGQGGEKVGRVQLDGTTGRDDAFASFANPVAALAATDSAVYVATKPIAGNTVTLSRVDTSGTKTDLFGGAAMCSTAPGGASAYSMGLGIDGSYLYYICEQGPSNQSARYLARATLDGSTRDESFASLSSIAADSSRFTVGGGYAYFKAGTGFGADRVYRVALTAGAAAAGVGSADTVQAMAWASAGLFWINTGNTQSISRFSVADFPSWTSTSVLSPITSSQPAVIAANTKSVFWRPGGLPAIAKANADGSGTANLSFVAPSGMSMFGYLAVDPSGPGGDTPTPAPAPAPTPGATPAATPAATVVKAPTQSTTADSNGNVAVTLSLQLDEVGKYTFIFEKVTSNEMSREQASGSSRISMQKGTKIGKRKLTKVVTAANVTTTSAGAKLVMRALLKKAQAKKWNLRVIHTATNGTLTQSVIEK